MTRTIAFAAMLHVMGSTLVMAQQPAETPPCKSVDEVFARYKQAKETNDWKALFLLGTPEHQREELLWLAVEISVYGDDTYKRLATEYGLDVMAMQKLVKEYDESDAEGSVRLRKFDMDAMPLIERVTKKLEFFEAAKKYVREVGTKGTYGVRELKDVVYQGDMASGVSIESWAVLEEHSDYPNGPVRMVPGTTHIKSELTFRKLNGNWYLATTDEVGKLNAEVQQ